MPSVSSMCAALAAAHWEGGHRLRPQRGFSPPTFYSTRLSGVPIQSDPGMLARETFGPLRCSRTLFA